MPLFDVLLLIAIALIAWWVAGEGFCGAAVSLLAVLFSGLAAMNFFEPLAEWLETVFPPNTIWSNSADVIALVGLFVVGVVVLHAATRRALGGEVETHPLIEEPGRWLCGAATGYIAAAFLLTALHTVPLPREFLGFTPERKNLFGIAAPDRQWLGFTQYVSEHVFPRNITVADGRGGTLSAKRVFDGAIHVTPDGGVEYRSSFPIRYAERRGPRAAE
ncbi:MAG: CvpA family protein [Planctomycetaceae bacterium]